MSYILDALRKSDQQRQRERGVAPTLLTAQASVAAPRRPAFWPYGLLAAVLLGAGIAIGWLRPWQAAPPPLAPPPIAARAHISNPQAPAPLRQMPEMAGMTAQELPAPDATPVLLPAARIEVKPPDIPAPASIGMTATLASVPAPIADKHANPVDAAQEPRAMLLTELPVSIQQEIPAIAIQLHAYSARPADRLVSINSMLLHEGESLTPELKLEQITPEGVILSYKGYRIQRGIR